MSHTATHYLLLDDMRYLPHHQYAWLRFEFHALQTTDYYL